MPEFEKVFFLLALDQHIVLKTNVPGFEFSTLCCNHWKEKSISRLC